MALHKIKDFYPNYRDFFGDNDILGYDLYSGEEKIGSVDDLMVDEEGKFRYLIVSTGVWIFGKKVLLPIGRARMDYGNRRVYVDGLTREQVENLPEFTNDQIDPEHEERVRGVYRPATGVGTATGQTAGLGSTSVEATPPVDRSAAVEASSGLGNREIDRDAYSYDRDPSLYGLTDRDHQHLRLYEERLIAEKTRHKTGEVIVGKHVETESAHVAVPVERERVVVERHAPTDMRSTVTPGADAFQEGEVARVEVYEETPEIRKETFVREEVDVRKQVDRETVEANETIRREQLDVDREGNPVVRDPNQPIDRRP